MAAWTSPSLEPMAPPPPPPPPLPPLLLLPLSPPQAATTRPSARHATTSSARQRAPSPFDELLKVYSLPRCAPSRPPPRVPGRTMVPDPILQYVRKRSPTARPVPRPAG